MIVRFNIRVYFLLFSKEKNALLLSDEWIGGKAFTKFPGGGLEFGEGIIEALHREAIEELGQEIEVIEHFYTTEDFVQSAFNPKDQIISIYYTARLLEEQRFRTTDLTFDFLQREKHEESFRWVTIDQLSPEEMSFPIDKKVVELVRKKML